MLVGLALLFAPEVLAQPIIRSLPLAAIDVAPVAGTDALLVLTYDASSGAALRLVDPVSGAVIRSRPLPGVPSRFAREGYGPGLAVADDGSTAYVARSDSGRVTQVDLQHWQIERSIVLPTVHGSVALAEGLAVQPGHPGVLAVSLHLPNLSPTYGGLVVYDQGVRRPHSLPDHSGPSRIAFAGTASRLYGIGSEVGQTPLYEVRIDAQGAHLIDLHGVVSEAFTSDFVYAGGLILTDQGAVVREAGHARLGTLPGTGYGTPDVQRLFTSDDADRVHLLSSTFLRTYWLDDLSQAVQFGLGSAVNLTSTFASVARWGTRGIAISTGSALVLVESPLFTGAFAAPAAAPVFSFAPAASPATGHVWIHNRGNAVARFEALSVEGPFEVATGPVSVAPRDSVQVAVTFVPGRFGTYVGRLTAASAQPDAVGPPVQVSLQAMSTKPSILEPPSTLWVGQIPAHAVSTAYLPLTNPSGSDVQLGMSFRDGSVFSVAGDAVLTVPAGASTHLTVSFAPTEAGTYEDTLVLHHAESGITDTVTVVGQALNASTTGTEGFAFYLGTVAPHPVGASARVEYGVAEPGRVRLDLFDTVGRHVASLVDGEHAPGVYMASLDVNRLATGVYHCRLTSEGRIHTRALVVVR